MSETTYTPDKVYPGTLYDYSAGCFVGVLVTERVMRKLAKLQAQHLEAVRRVLHDNPDDVFPSMWTLHYPNGKQTTVKFIDTSESAERRIRNATIGHPPKPHHPVFIAGSMSEAKELADARHAALTDACPLCGAPDGVCPSCVVDLQGEQHDSDLLAMEA